MHGTSYFTKTYLNKRALSAQNPKSTVHFFIILMFYFGFCCLYFFGGIFLLPLPPTPTVHKFNICSQMLEVWRQRRRINKMAYTAKDPRPPPQRFLYLTETKSWRCEGGQEEEENVHLLTHATAWGMGKNPSEDPSSSWRGQ